MTDDAKPPYEVGYGRPPRATQFKAGHCPNPKGRPKGSKNFSTELNDALNESVIVNVNGQRKKISKRKAAAMQLANKAAGGDPKTLPILMQHDVRFQQDRVSSQTPEPQGFGAKDEPVLQSIIDRILQATATPMESEENPEPEKGA